MPKRGQTLKELKKTRRPTPGRVEPEPPENPEARDGEADEIGIEIDHAAERPRQD